MCSGHVRREPRPTAAHVAGGNAREAEDGLKGGGPMCRGHVRREPQPPAERAASGKRAAEVAALADQKDREAVRTRRDEHVLSRVDRKSR